MKVELLDAIFRVVCFSHCVQSINSQPDGPPEIRAGLLLQTGGVEIFDQVRIQPAVDIAIEKVKALVDTGSYMNFSLSYVFQSTGAKCSPSVMMAPGVASDLFYRHGVRLFLGPACSFECKGVSDLAAFWNVPVLSGASTSGDLGNKAQYKTLTRTAFQLGAMGRFAVALFKKWSWTRCSIIWNDTSIWKITATSVKGKLEEAGIYINPVVLGLQESNQAALDAAVRRGRSKILTKPLNGKTLSFK